MQPCGQGQGLNLHPARCAASSSALPNGPAPQYAARRTSQAQMSAGASASASFTQGVPAASSCARSSTARSRCASSEARRVSHVRFASTKSKRRFCSSMSDASRGGPSNSDAHSSCAAAGHAAQRRRERLARARRGEGRGPQPQAQSGGGHARGAAWDLRRAAASAGGRALNISCAASVAEANGLACVSSTAACAAASSKPAREARRGRDVCGASSSRASCARAQRASAPRTLCQVGLGALVQVVAGERAGADARRA